jgi:hypothetical protein
MASELTVQTLRGPTSGANANTVLIPSGQTLHAPGHMVQFEFHQHDPGGTTVTSTSLVDTGLTLNITPKFSNSHFYIVASMYESYTQTNNSSIQYAINRNGTVIGDHQGATIGYQSTNPHYWNTTLTFVDTPNTTSMLTYKIQAKSPYGHAVYHNGDNTQTHLQVMEIAQ